MATLVIMPRQGQALKAVLLPNGKKKKGDNVAVKDVLFLTKQISRHLMKNPLPRELYWRFFAEEGDDVPCLNPVCIIGNAGEDISALVAEAKNSSGEDGASEEAQSGVKTPEVNDSTEKMLCLQRRLLRLPRRRRRRQLRQKSEDGFMRISPRAIC